MPRLIVISGCSGGGKSTLLDELRARGCAVVSEVGRRLLREELACGGTALPWADPTAFLRRKIEEYDAIAGEIERLRAEVRSMTEAAEKS